jgi:hypothetical protein
MAKSPEITPELLQNLSFEIIVKLVTYWRAPKEAGVEFKDQGALVQWKFNMGLRLHSAIIDAMRYNQDLNQLAKLQATVEELLHERELAVKSGVLTGKLQATEPAATSDT